MEPCSEDLEQLTSNSVGDYWTNKSPALPGTSTVYNQNWDSQSPDVVPSSLAAAQEAKKKDLDGLQDYTRADIELQLATLLEYMRNKKLRPILWTCCACSKEQKYRENLDPVDRLRCQYPRCGVSDKGFRIYRVHDMCERCIVFVDARAPVTRKALKKKRDEVRAVLKKIKKVYEDVDCLLAFDEKEAERMAGFLEGREAREELDREKKVEEAMHRVEMARLRKHAWVGDGGDGDDSQSDYGGEEEERGDEYEEEERTEAQVPTHREKHIGRTQKRRGFKRLLRL